MGLADPPGRAWGRCWKGLGGLDRELPSVSGLRLCRECGALMDICLESPLGSSLTH